MMSNFGLYKALDEIGIKYEKTAVSNKYVYENMSANGYRISSSRSYYFRKYDEPATYFDCDDDGGHACRGRCFSTAGSTIKVYPQVLVNIRVSDKAAHKTMRQYRKPSDMLNEMLVGTYVVRESGTEPSWLWQRHRIRAYVRKICQRSRCCD